MKNKISMCCAGLIAASAGLASADVLWDNGPFVTNPGGHPTGADASFLQSDLDMTTLGGNANVGSFRRADNFTVGAGGWEIDSITSFGYRTGSGLTSEIEGIFVQIWDGNPSAGANLVFGDMTTNLLTATEWTGAYRASTNSPSGSTRPIMSATAGLGGLFLDEGEYWVEIGMSSSAGTIWMVPVTIPGQDTTGDALTYTVSTESWAAWVDGGSQTALGMPFIINGTVIPAPGAVALLGLGGLMAGRRRRA